MAELLINLNIDPAWVKYSVEAEEFQTEPTQNHNQK